LYSWFSTSFTVPSSWSGRQILLNFAAVDYEATVYINGNQVGFNRGGYFRFTIDATEHVSFNGANEMYGTPETKKEGYADDLQACICA
tara:strand:- start:2222 stop:2485 length:264 start_codon:yes stop_codon:yes gene_type:complete